VSVLDASARGLITIVFGWVPYDLRCACNRAQSKLGSLSPEITGDVPGSGRGIASLTGHCASVLFSSSLGRRFDRA
jgi:hypothetical protein